MKILTRFFFFSLCCVQGSTTFAQATKPPRVLDPAWKLDRVAIEPQIVTPTACCFDRQGRLFVVECHTHFPPDDYDGPTTDRILVFDDSDGDGTLDRRSVFYEGGVATMGLLVLGANSVIAVTRDKVTRHRDTDDDGQCDQSSVLLTLKTEASYPHNGLAGIAAKGENDLLIGLGENFGDPYELIAADGSRQVGGGEGGSIFQLSADGETLRRLATGFWNPFGICVDNEDRIWTVGNDPDAMPPCRLIHVIDGGDYGFQFRFGRAGTHPLQAWNGELPGTLPFAAATGEAPCAVIPVGSELWVTSWGDNRVERYVLEPRGATWKSQTRSVVQGGPEFRPVGLAQAPDGSIYFTDWVSRDYSVHQKGRIWRLSRVDQKVADRPESRHATTRPGPTDVSSEDRQAIRDEREVQPLIVALDSSDPFVHQSAMASLSESSRLDALELDKQANSRRSLGILAANRWRELSRPDSVSAERRLELIRNALKIENDDVRLLALRWAAERDVSDVMPEILHLLESDLLSTQLFRTTIATVSYLEHGAAKRGTRDPSQERLLMRIAGDQDRSDQIRAMSIRMIPSDAEQPDAEKLMSWITDSKGPLTKREAVWLMIDRGDSADRQNLFRIASSSEFTDSLRADAVIGLNSDHLATIENTTSGGVIEDELRRNVTTDRDAQSHPSPTDIEAWMRLVGTGGDARAGRRVFQRATCANCHVHSGRGATTGPELTTLEGQDRKRILRSILQPSQEIGPLYVPWQILTVDGQVKTGLKLATPGVGQELTFQGADGKSFSVSLTDIEYHSPTDQSIMPAGLEKSMSITEIKDLLAFLTQTDE